MKKLLLSIAMLSLCAAAAFAQAPRPSQKASITQTVGDASISITYHRPNVNGREVWGKLVPYGQVWRTGANDATLFETNVDLTINGQKLPAGKYAFFAIPTATDWTLIFNKKFDQWGTEYEQNKAQDALKVTGVKTTTGEMIEALNYEFETVTSNTAKIVLKWEKLRVPFTVDVGDVNARVFAKLKDGVATAKADDFRAPLQAAGFVINNKLKEHYGDAMTWIDKSISIRENFSNMRAKAMLFAEMGKTAEAIAAGEKAVALGKASTPPANSEILGMLEKSIADWKAKK